MPTIKHTMKSGKTKTNHWLSIIDQHRVEYQSCIMLHSMEPKKYKRLLQHIESSESFMKERDELFENLSFIEHIHMSSVHDMVERMDTVLHLYKTCMKYKKVLHFYPSFRLTICERAIHYMSLLLHDHKHEYHSFLVESNRVISELLYI